MIDYINVPLVSSTTGASDVDALNADGKYLFRYRIVSKDKNRISEWSQVKELSVPSLYEINGGTAISTATNHYVPDDLLINSSISPRESGDPNSFVVSWGSVQKTPSAYYDVYLSWRRARLVAKDGFTLSNVTQSGAGSAQITYFDITLPGDVDKNIFKQNDIILFTDTAASLTKNMYVDSIYSASNKIKCRIYTASSGGAPATSPTQTNLWVLKDWEDWQYEATTKENTLNFQRKAALGTDDMYLYVQAYIRLSDFPKNKYPSDIFQNEGSHGVQDKDYLKNFVSISKPITMLSNGKTQVPIHTATGLQGMTARVSITGREATFTKMSIPLIMDTSVVGTTADNEAALKDLIGKKILVDSATSEIDKSVYTIIGYTDNEGFVASSSRNFGSATADSVTNIRF